MRSSPAPEPDNWLDKALKRQVAVHTVHDQTFEGTLIHAHDDGVLLWGAAILSGVDRGGEVQKVRLSGEVFIPRDRVLFVQTVRA